MKYRILGSLLVLVILFGLVALSSCQGEMEGAGETTSEFQQ
jgi:hypothetical protein